MTDDSEQLIRGLAPEFQPYVFNFVAAIRRAGVPLVIISGRRATATADPDGNIALDSFHLHGQAFDVQVQGYQREELNPVFWSTIGRYWASMGGRWGGDFRLVDVNHFDSGWAPPGTKV